MSGDAGVRRDLGFYDWGVRRAVADDANRESSSADVATTGEAPTDGGD